MKRTALWLGFTLFNLLASSCSQHFYSKVSGNGKINGYPSVEWQKPDSFIYREETNGEKFSFKTSEGDVITPKSISTTGGSVPRVLWMQKGYSPWTYAPGYLIHDWLYEANRRRIPGGRNAEGKEVYYTKEQADWILVEAIKAQMENEIYRAKSGKSEKSATRLRKIFLAVHYGGWSAWRDKPNPVDPTPTPIVAAELPNSIPLAPMLNTIKAELTPAPGKPDMEASTKPVPQGQ